MPAGIYLFKAKNGNTCSDVFIVNIEHIFQNLF